MSIAKQGIWYWGNRRLDTDHLYDVIVLVNRMKSNRYGKIEPKIIELWEFRKNKLARELNEKARALGHNSFLAMCDSVVNKYKKL